MPTTEFPIFVKSVVTQDPQQSRRCLEHLAEIVDAWGLSDTQLEMMTRLHAEQFRQWRSQTQAVEWDRDQLERLSVIASIHRMLEHLVREPESIRAWLNFPQPGSPFNGLSPLQTMTGGTMRDLYAVDNWLKCRIEATP